jgi:DNA-binding response OmpR family regulator
MFDQRKALQGVEAIKNARDQLKTLADEALKLYGDLRNPAEHLLTDAIRLGLLPTGSRLVLPSDSKDTDQFELSWGGIFLKTPILTIPSLAIQTNLTPSENDITARLLSAEGEVLSREALLAGANRIVDVHVTRMRNKVAPADIYKTVRGYGYRMKAVE